MNLVIIIKRGNPLETLFLHSHCSKNYSHRFTPLISSKNGGKDWQLDSAQKLIGTPKEKAESKFFSRHLNLTLIKETFHCPYCKNVSLTQCSRCETYMCWDGVTLGLTCINPSCRHTGKINEKIKHFKIEKGGN